MADEDNVKGTGELMKQAEAGMALFKADVEAETDKDAAKAYKDEADAKFKALEAEAAALTGKDNKNARSAKSKEASAVKKEEKYVDAERVLKGNQPKFGNFIKTPAPKEEKKEAAPAAAPAEEEKKEDKKDDKKKPAKKTESAGISPDERKELEKLKTDIIAKKASLKETGMSGGQINKDPEIVTMVTRMNELKEKESPGSTTAAKDEKKAAGGGKKKLSAEAEAEVANLEKEIEEYRTKLAGPEFGYSKKEIQSDPDMMEMTAKLKALKK